MFSFLKPKNPHNKIFSQNEFWIRLVTLLKHAGIEVLRNIFHDPSYGGRSRDPATLYSELQPYESNVRNCLKKRILAQDQYDLIYPLNGKTDSNTFDITLLIFLIINCTRVKPPMGRKGWQEKTLDDSDETIGAYILRLRKFRNKIIHCFEMTFQEFHENWNYAIHILDKLGYDINSVRDLKNGSLSDLETFKISILQAKIKHLESSIDILSTGISKNETVTAGLHLQQGVLSSDIKTINETIRDISVDSSNLELMQHDHEFEISSLKAKLQIILHETENVKMKLERSNFNYGISLAQTCFVLKTLIDTNFRKMEKDISQLKADVKVLKEKGGLRKFPVGSKLSNFFKKSFLKRDPKVPIQVELKKKHF